MSELLGRFNLVELLLMGIAWMLFVSWFQSSDGIIRAIYIQIKRWTKPSRIYRRIRYSNTAMRIERYRGRK